LSLHHGPIRRRDVLLKQRKQLSLFEADVTLEQVRERLQVAALPIQRGDASLQNAMLLEEARDRLSRLFVRSLQRGEHDFFLGPKVRPEVASEKRSRRLYLPGQTRARRNCLSNLEDPHQPVMVIVREWNQAWITLEGHEGASPSLDRIDVGIGRVLNEVTDANVNIVSSRILRILPLLNEHRGVEIDRVHDIDRDQDTSSSLQPPVGSPAHRRIPLDRRPEDCRDRESGQEDEAPGGKARVMFDQCVGRLRETQPIVGKVDEDDVDQAESSPCIEASVASHRGLLRLPSWQRNGAIATWSRATVTIPAISSSPLKRPRAVTTAQAGSRTLKDLDSRLRGNDASADHYLFQRAA
jgi:hypothetical protein